MILKSIFGMKQNIALYFSILLFLSTDVIPSALINDDERDKPSSSNVKNHRNSPPSKALIANEEIPFIDLLSTEALLEIFSHLPIDTLSRSTRTCKYFYTLAHDSLQRRVRSSLKGMNNPVLSQNSEEEQNMAQLIKNSPKYAAYYRDQLLEGFNTNALLFIPKNPFLESEIHETLSKEAGVRLLTLETIEGAPEREIISALFPNTIEHTIFHTAVIQDLSHRLKIYVAPKQEAKIWSIHKTSLIKSMTDLQTGQNYISFAEMNIKNERYKEIPHCLILTTDELEDLDTKDPLQSFLETNSEHKIILTLSHNSVNAAGKYNLSKENIPSNLKHLILSDPYHLVTKIGNSFLHKTDSLQSISFSGFKNLRIIKDLFLSEAEELRTIDLSSLIHVTEIGGFFLDEAINLETIDLSPLGDVEIIGDSFIDGAKNIKMIDLSSWNKIKEMGDSFLYDLESLKIIKLPLKGTITKIGNCFLGNTPLEGEKLRAQLLEEPSP